MKINDILTQDESSNLITYFQIRNNSIYNKELTCITTNTKDNYLIGTDPYTKNNKEIVFKNEDVIMNNKDDFQNNVNNILKISEDLNKAFKDKHQSK